MGKNPTIVKRYYIYEKCCDNEDCKRNKYVDEYIKGFEESNPHDGKVVRKDVKNKKQLKEWTEKLLGSFCWTVAVDLHGNPHPSDILIVDEYNDGFKKIAVPMIYEEDEVPPEEHNPMYG